MPSEVMDQRRISPLYDPSVPSSIFSDETHCQTERHVGFWKPELVSDNHGKDGMKLTSENKSVDLLQKSMGVDTETSFELLQAPFHKGQKTESSFKHLVEDEGTAGRLNNPWESTVHDMLQSSSLYPKQNKLNLNAVPFENALFSSSLSELFKKKVTLLSNNDLFGNSTHPTNCNLEEDEPFESMEEIEAQTIGDLLPDDDDLLSGVIDDLDCVGQVHNNNDVEDDLFCSVGGMEIEEVDSSGLKDSELADGTSDRQQVELNNFFAEENPYGEYPSRTLFVRNINSNVEDAELRDLFKQYGDIRTLYTACKHRGFVMISYYDIRSARHAMKELQNKPLRRRKLDIHFSIPKDNPSEKDINQGILVVCNLESSVSNDELHQFFGLYGEIKEIRETPHNPHRKIVVFYDIRAAEAAVHALNSNDIAGKKIKLEPSCIGPRCLMQLHSFELDHDEIRKCHRQSCSPNNLLRGQRGTIPIGPITCNGAMQGLQSVSRAPISLHADYTFNGISSSIPHSLSSSIRSCSLANNNNQTGLGVSHSLGQVNFGFQCMPSFHPHSLPERHDGILHGIPFNSPNTMSGIPMNVARSTEAVDDRHIAMGLAGICGPSFERTERVFVASGNSNYPVCGHQRVWNNSNSFPSPPGPVMWPNSPSFTNNIPFHPSSQMHGIPRSPSHMLNTITPVPNHHVGSAPTINPSIWERCHSFAGEPTVPSAFHPGSLGSIGFSANSTLSPNDLASGNVFPNIGGSFVEPSISSLHVGLASPQQRCNIFHGPNGMFTMPAAFDSPTDRIRSRKNDTNSNQADKKQYELDIEHIISRKDDRTTLMIKNIPNKYTSKMLLAAIDERHRGSYDFIYLPIDFKNKCNVGYAFINMTDSQQIIPFYKEFNGKKWEKFNSEKVASLAYARIQGKAALVAHFQNSSLMNEDKRCRPILFHSDGPNAGDQEPFPMGVNIRSRVGRSRNHDNEDNQDNPLNSANDEASKEVMTPSGSTQEME